MAWRIKQLQVGDCNGERAKVERAFNILANPQFRKCYDALRQDECAPGLFPYAGGGSILVEGDLSADSETFFAHRILAYRPAETHIAAVSTMRVLCGSHSLSGYKAETGSLARWESPTGSELGSHMEPLETLAEEPNPGGPDVYTHHETSLFEAALDSV
jgi:hypothetical protein